MKSSNLILLLALVASFGLIADAHEVAEAAETVTPRLQLPLPNFPGTSFTSAIVKFPPGAKAAPHQHGDAFVYAYVLSGSVRSQLNDEPSRVYSTGQDWYEAPHAHHRLTENVSQSEPAQLLVVFISPSGAPLKTPE